MSHTCITKRGKNLPQVTFIRSTYRDKAIYVPSLSKLEQIARLVLHKTSKRHPYRPDMRDANFTTSMKLRAVLCRNEKEKTYVVMNFSLEPLKK